MEAPGLHENRIPGILNSGTGEEENIVVHSACLNSNK